ncbi:MAG TPA: signal recognition particle-docking protein FtsY [Streptosporangiaceae bacterium]|nr:signal recognition particle-docking protein FtsY [Streptosporangiaceae bacterium]
MEILIIILAILAVVVIGGGTTLLVRPRRRRVAPPQPPAVPGRGAETGPQRAGEAGEETGGASTAVLPPPAEAPAARPTEPAPAPLRGRLVRLRGRLARSQSGFGSVLLGLLSRDTLDEQAWEDIEDTLLTADMGVAPSRQIVEELRTQVKVSGTRTPAEVRAMLRADLLQQIGPDNDRSLRTQRHGDRPAVILIVGVNGTGKTTVAGKLARALIGEGETVLLGAADTFRAAAADQLQTWGQRVGARVVRSDREGADPASVAFESVSEGIDERADAVIVDTAGRLHTKTGLMDELGKIKRVIEKRATVDEVLLVLDATTGQNGLRQARVFAEAVDITGIVLTKLDGTAKGGIVVAIARELRLPVRYVGVGEKLEDILPFDSGSFVDSLLD